MPMMKAVRYHHTGGPDVLVYEDAPRPVAGAGQVLVRVHAAGINPADWKARRGNRFTPELPAIPGWDISGVVAALGPNVTAFQAGDEVFGMICFPKPGNAYAEYTVAPITDIALKPRTLSHTEAASLPLVALTSWQALFDTAHVQAGQRVLILGASGGTGHLAVQLAKWQGAYVIGTASARNADFVRKLGVDQFIDYTTTRLEDVLDNVDVAYDTVGQQTAQQAVKTLKPGGILVMIAGGPPSAEVQTLAADRGARVQGMLVHPDSAALKQIAALADAGVVKPMLDTVLPLAEARRAHELGETNRTRGKIVLAAV